MPQLSPDVYTPARDTPSRAEALLMRGAFSIPLFVLLLAAAFFLTFAPHMPGDLLKEGIVSLLSALSGAAERGIASPVLRSLLADGLLPALGTVLGFLPQILMLFFFLIVLEESGLLSRLAALTDGAFSAVGLNGRAVFSIVMGFGCTAAAVLTTRALDDKRVQRRTSVRAGGGDRAPGGARHALGGARALCHGTCASAMSAAAFCRQILALSGKTVYNKDGDDHSRLSACQLAALLL